jgi:hypothetical protein
MMYWIDVEASRIKSARIYSSNSLKVEFREDRSGEDFVFTIILASQIRNHSIHRNDHAYCNGFFIAHGRDR